MNRTALIYESLSLDWFGIVVAAACLVGLCVACLLRKFQKGSVNEILTVFCIGTPLAMILSRVQYCTSRVDLGEFGIGYIFTGMRDGGYGLYGAMAGILAAALLAALLFKSSLGEIADCVAVAGAGIITVGRFATRFTMDSLGFAMAPNAFTVRNDADGLDYLAVFYLDGIVESVIFVICLGLFFFCYGRKNSSFTKGNVALIFLMLHGLNQVVMDSLRTVTLCLFDNDFIKASQIIGIVSWLVIIIVFVCRLVKKQLFKKGFFGIFAAFAVLIIVAVRMEYRVGNSNYISAHIVMGICMVIMAILSMVIVAISDSKPKNITPPDDDSASEDRTADEPQEQNFSATSYTFDGSNEQAPKAVEKPYDEPELYDDFDYSYEPISVQQPYDSELEDDFDYMYQEIGRADMAQPFIAPAQPEQTYPMPAIENPPMQIPSPAASQQPSAPQKQHRISNDTLDDLRRQFSEMDGQ